MLKEGVLDRVLLQIKKLIPKSVFNFFAPMYHSALAYLGAFLYGFPSRSMKVIGVTGTKGKSTVVFLTAKILEGALRQAQGDSGGVAAIGSLGFKIKDKEWPNTLKMTMPGRFRLQKFLAEAKRAGCKYVVLEVTSEGIKQKRHLGIDFDCAVFTNLHKEHIESHGSFEKYYQAKQELFKRTKNIQVLNADDPNIELFGNFQAEHKIFFGFKKGDIVPQNIRLSDSGSSFDVYGTHFNINLAGEFNIMNCLAVLAVGAMYKVDLPTAKPLLESVKSIPGRMEFVKREPFAVVVDYAHTPDSLEQVYKTLKGSPPSHKASEDKTQISQRLICVLGAAGGGRDKWKRPEFGRIAAQYCDEIILTNEDPYDENPLSIIKEIESGFPQSVIHNSKFVILLDRREAIKKAIDSAQSGDTVIITGKGSESSMAIGGGKKIPWSDKKAAEELAL